MNKLHKERFPPRCYLDPTEFTMECEDFAAVAQLKLTGIADVQYLSLTEHQHILAEKEKRIERLREALKVARERVIDLDKDYGSSSYYTIGVIDAALQEETK